MVASNYDKKTREEDNTFMGGHFGIRLLKSAVVYGANASGKSKLFEAMAFMRHFILTSSKEGQIDDPIDVQPFLLSDTTEGKPSSFEIIFIHKGEMYRYGFETDRERIHAEWLYHRPKTKEVELFYRDFQDFSLHKTRFRVTDLIANDRIRPNALLLSVAASWNDKTAGKIFDWFRAFNVISGLKGKGFEGFSMTRVSKNKKVKSAVLKYLKGADLGIEDLEIEKLEANDLPIELKELFNKITTEGENFELLSDVVTYHKKYGKDNLPVGLVKFSMEKDESTGTKKYFALSGPVLETLQNGEVLIVDELANALHPNLVRKLSEMFNSKKYNPNNAQLIFNTHNTMLLNAGLFRRDQIWFTEKDRYGAASLYSLGDFKSDKVRKENNFEKNYLKGKYGAIPFLNDFEKTFSRIK